MGSSPPPSGPPIEPPERRMVGTAMVIVGLIIAVAIAVVWFGFHLLSNHVYVKVTERTPNSKVVTVKTPVGDFKIARERNISDLQIGLPIYPGAMRERVTGNNDSIAVSFSLPQQVNLRVAVAKFDTPDPIAKVRQFYKQQLGGEVTSLSRTGDDGKTVFEIKYGQQDKVVILKPRDGGTHIELVRFFHGYGEPN